jgi:flagellar hook-length control protein FliK
MDGLVQDNLPKKSEMGLVDDGMMMQGENGDLKLEGLTKKISIESDANTEESLANNENEKINKTDSLADLSINEFSHEGIDVAKLDAGEEKTGFVDALKAETEKSLRDESAMTERFSNTGMKPEAHFALVDADKEADAESLSNGKVKDKRKERLAALENGEGRVEASRDNVTDKASNTIDGDFSSQKVDADIVVELRDGRSQAEDRGLAREVRNAGTFQDMLSMELRDGLNTEIVRHANIVLRQNGEGLIRLTLHPESLGNIKIKLEMADNKVSGRIVFESDEAMKAFEKEIASLEQSFKDSGFDGASLEMALSSDHQNDGNGQQWRGEEARPFFSERFVSSSYDLSSDYDGMPVTARERNFALVDIMV